MFKWLVVRNGKFQHMSTIRCNHIDYSLSNLAHPDIKRRSWYLVSILLFDWSNQIIESKLLCIQVAGVEFRLDIYGIFHFNWRMYLYRQTIQSCPCKRFTCKPSHNGGMRSLTDSYDVILKNMINRLLTYQQYDDVITWKHFPRYWPIVRGIHRSPLDPLHKSQWALIVFFDVLLNKRLNKQSSFRWFDTPRRSLWRQWNKDTVEHEPSAWIMKTIVHRTYYSLCLFANSFQLFRLSYMIAFRYLWMSVLFQNESNLEIIIYNPMNNKLHGLWQLNTCCCIE